MATCSRNQRYREDIFDLPAWLKKKRCPLRDICMAAKTEPQIREVLRIKEYGQDYFHQVTDARPDTGGLSGGTPSEAVSWGSMDPDRLPDAAIAMPLLPHYELARRKPRKPKRLFDRRPKIFKLLAREYFTHNGLQTVDGSEPVVDRAVEELYARRLDSPHVG